MANNFGTSAKNPFEGSTAPDVNEDDTIEILDHEAGELREYEMTNEVREQYENQIESRLKRAHAEWYDMWWEGNTLCVEYEAYIAISPHEQMTGGRKENNFENLMDGRVHPASKIIPVNNIARISIQERADERPEDVEDLFVKPWSPDEGEEPVEVHKQEEPDAEAVYEPDFDKIRDKLNEQGKTRKQGYGTRYNY